MLHACRMVLCEGRCLAVASWLNINQKKLRGRDQRIPTLGSRMTRGRLRVRGEIGARLTVETNATANTRNTTDTRGLGKARRETGNEETVGWLVGFDRYTTDRMKESRCLLALEANIGTSASFTPPLAYRTHNQTNTPEGPYEHTHSTRDGLGVETAMSRERSGVGATGLVKATRQRERTFGRLYNCSATIGHQTPSFPPLTAASPPNLLDTDDQGQWRRCDVRARGGGRGEGGGGEATLSDISFPLLHHTQSQQGDNAEVGTHLVAIQPVLLLG
jgi:hypothetical protein